MTTNKSHVWVIEFWSYRGWARSKDFKPELTKKAASAAIRESGRTNYRVVKYASTKKDYQRL
jgi:hypothetical protein